MSATGLLTDDAPHGSRSRRGGLCTDLVDVVPFDAEEVFNCGHTEYVVLFHCIIFM